MYKLLINLLFVALATQCLAQTTSGESSEDVIKRRNYDTYDSKYSKWFKKLSGLTELLLYLRINRIIGQSESYDGSVVGLGFGVRFNLLTLPNQTEIKAGLAYSMQGGAYENYQYEPGGNMRASSANVRLNYLQVPLSARYKIKESFFVEAGLQPGLLLSANDRHDGRKDQIREIFNPLDLGLMLGVAYQFPQKWGIGLQLNQGLTNINRKSGPYAGVRDRNAGLGLRVSYML